MTVTIYVPRDSGALSLGAEKVAKAIAGEIERRGADARIVRNGSRGLYWLEPMVEVETSARLPDASRRMTLQSAFPLLAVTVPPVAAAEPPLN